MIKIRISPNRAVDCRAVLAVPLSAVSAWGQIRDFQSFARSDFFHAQIDIAGGLPRAGAELRITHRFFLFRAERAGRICRWKEFAGYAFSDLSLAGSRRGFPHIFSYRLEPNGENCCNLHIRIAGKWTARFIPRPFIWLWLRWILQGIVQQIENKLLLYQVWLKDRRREPAR